jgi:hypothetical protein
MTKLLEKLKSVKGWLSILPTVILSVVLVLQDNGIDLSGFYEGLIAFCAAMTAGGAMMKPKTPAVNVPENNAEETKTVG